MVSALVDASDCARLLLYFLLCELTLNEYQCNSARLSSATLALLALASSSRRQVMMRTTSTAACLT
jgi:hypothetical protein